MKKSGSLSNLKTLAKMSSNSPSIEDLRRGSAFSFNGYLERAKSALGIQRLSNPSLVASDSDLDLHKTHYVHAELQFIMALIEIGNRLVSVQKEARQNSLIAELTLLNHNLPADVCLPLFCTGSDNDRVHHKIMRICPKEAVVLNSANSAPFLILVEVLDYHTLDEANDTPNDTPPNHEKVIPLESSRENSSRISPHPTLDTSLKFSDKSDNNLNPTSPKEYYNNVMNRRTSAVSLSTAAGMHDDFSDRLKTAAVMLAQLYNQQKLDQISTATLTRKRIGNNSYMKMETRPPSSSSIKTKSKFSADFEMIRNRVVKEMVEAQAALLEKGSEISNAPDELIDHNLEASLHNAAKDDPSAAVFRESFAKKVERVRASSPFGKSPHWKLYSVIVKAGSDLRQEHLALQLMSEISRIWKAADCKVWIYCYQILVASDEAGLIETIPDSISIHSIKKDGYANGLNQKGVAFTLYDYFVKEFGDPGSESFLEAQDNFMRSLAGYCLISYILQVKDRHNGNILIDKKGHIIHIDFGFVLSNSPGSVGFEMAPFKLPLEYIDILEGQSSRKFSEFRTLMQDAFKILRKSSDQIICLCEIMEKSSFLACFTGANSKPTAAAEKSIEPFRSSLSSDADMRIPETTKVEALPVSAALRDRFFPSLSEPQVDDALDGLIDNSCNNIFSRLYDSFQYYSQNVF